MILASFDSLATLHGGVEAYVHQLALALQDEGHEVRVFARAPRQRSAGAPPGVAYEFALIPAFAASHRTRLLFQGRFARALAQSARWADVVHGQNADGLGALGVRPLVATAHTTPVDEWASSRLGGWREALYQRRLHERDLARWRELAARASHFFAVGDHVAESLRSLGARRVEVVSNPVTPMKLVSQAEARHKLGLASGPIVLYVGRLARVKRVDRLLDAMRKLPEARAIVAGEGPERAALQASAPANVAFRGRVDDAEKALLYSAADALCLPSEHEGQPLVLLEALSAGLPIVATRAEWVPAELRARGYWGEDLAALLREALAKGRGAGAPIASYRDLARRYSKAYEEAARA